jgi:hypothetical protein
MTLSVVTETYRVQFAAQELTDKQLDILAEAEDDLIDHCTRMYKHFEADIAGDETSVLLQIYVTDDAMYWNTTVLQATRGFTQPNVDEWDRFYNRDITVPEGTPLFATVRTNIWRQTMRF